MRRSDEGHAGQSGTGVGPILPTGAPGDSVQRVGVLSELPDLLLDHGLDPDAIAERAGLDPRVLRDPDALIPVSAMGRLLRLARRETGCASIGLLVGRRGSLRSLGLMGEYMAHAPDLGTALMDMSRHNERFVMGALPYLLRLGDEVVFGYRVPQFSVEATEQICDGAIGLAYNLVHELCGRHPIEVLLAHAETADLRPFSRAFGVPVRYDAEHYALVYPASILAQPVPGADPARRAELRGVVEAFWGADPPDILAQLRRLLAVSILGPDHSLAAAAAALDLHPRVLNRRLKARGTTFRRELADARFILAGQLVEHTRLSMTVIAGLFGYADLSVFTRAFERWSGMPPSHWRRRAARAEFELAGMQA